MPTGWQILHVPDGVRGRDRRRLRGLLAALHALRRFARPKCPIPRRSAARRPLTAHFRPFCWPFGGNLPIPPRFWSKRGLFCVVSGLIAAHGGDLSAGGACPFPYAHAGGLHPLHHSRLTTRRRGRRAPQGADGAHGAASGARTARGREADRFLTVAANAAKARATPATKPPVFRRAGAQLFFAPLTEIFRIAARQRHGEKRGVVRGEKNTAGAATRTRQGGRRKTKRLETADASGRRQAAGAPEGRKGHAPARHADA